jgi:CDP-diacylglycerol--glycerol-3-phosphate 3-phosphatidyltransferase
MRAPALAKRGATLADRAAGLTYSAKAWGVTLFVATSALFGFGYGGLTLNLAIALGIIHTLEEIAMTLILPKWTHDVLSIVHALRLVLRKNLGGRRKP